MRRCGRSSEAYQKALLENARVLGETLRTLGCDIVTGGTDCHLLLVDLRPKNTTGKAAEASLERALITTNKNAIPFDPAKPRHHQRHPAGQPGGDDPRVRRGGVQAGGRDDQHRAGGAVAQQ